MSPISEQLLDELQEDLSYHAWVAQAVTLAEDVDGGLVERVREILTELLSSGKVAIGNAKLTSRDGYVEFTAWKGTIGERVDRAIGAVLDASERDKDFAYWLCRNDAVDRYEEDKSDD